MAIAASTLVMQPVLRLAWEHSCRGKGCSMDGCELCRHSRSRCCSAGCNLKPKFVSGDYLLANCGGEPVVRLVDQSGRQISALPAGWKLQVCILDNKKYTDLEIRQAGQPLRNDQLASCLITDRPMLKWEASSPATCITLPLQAGVVTLSELQCAKPIKADEHNKQSGQTTKYRLLLTVTQPPMSPTSQLQLTPVTPLVSEAFTLVTTRSKGAVKSITPLPDEGVGVLEGVGRDAMKELARLGLRIRAAAGLPGHLASVEKVAQFKQLVDWISEAPNTKLQLQLLLDATGMKPADYKKAAEHVQRTAFPDFRPRVWWLQGMNRGLLFSCMDAEVQFPSPLAWVVKGGPGMPDAITALEAVQPGQQAGQPAVLPGQQAVPQAVQLALQAWKQPGHGGCWGVYWCDAADPLAQRTLGKKQGLFSVQQLPAGVLAAAAASASAPMLAPVRVPSLSAFAPMVAAATTATPSLAAVATTMPLQLQPMPLQLLFQQQQLAVSGPQVVSPQQQVVLTQQQQTQLIQWHQLQIAQLQQQQQPMTQQQQQPLPVTLCEQQQQQRQSQSFSAALSGVASSGELASPFAAAAAEPDISAMAESAAPAAVLAAAADKPASELAGTAPGTAAQPLAQLAAAEGRAASMDFELAMQLEMEQVLRQGLLGSSCTNAAAAAGSPSSFCQQQQGRAKRAASWGLDDERASIRLAMFDSSCLDAMFPGCNDGTFNVSNDELQMQPQLQMPKQPQLQRAERGASWDMDAALGLVMEEILGEDLLLLESTAPVLNEVEGQQQEQQQEERVVGQQQAEAVLVPQQQQQQQQQEEGPCEIAVGFGLPDAELLSFFPATLVGDEAGYLDVAFADMAGGADLATVFGGKLTDSDVARLNDLAMSL